MQKFNYQKGNKATGKIYIGLDHGYGNIKTAHRVFQTGIECYDEEPIVSTNYVKYRDKYYVIGESHLVYQGNKTETDDFYILTLAGLAEEMKYRGLHEADVVLAVGLPLAWVKTQAAEWRNYLMREKELDFSFRKERYKVHLCGLEKYEKKIVALEKKVSDVNGLLDKMKQFISTRGLGEAFAEFVKSLEPKTMKERLTEKQKVVKKQTQQKSMHTQEHGTLRKHNISTEL